MKSNTTQRRKQRPKTAFPRSHLPRYSEIDTNVPRDQNSALIRLQVQARTIDQRRRNFEMFDNLDCTSASFRRGLQVIKSGTKRLPFAAMDSGRRFIHQMKSQMKSVHEIHPKVRPQTAAPERRHRGRRRIKVRLRPEPERKKSVKWLCNDIKGKKKRRKRKQVAVPETSSIF